MDWKLIIEVILFVTFFVSILVVFLRRMDASFAESAQNQSDNFAQIRTENRESFHSIDLKIHGVEVMVQPYAKDIATLKDTQTSNSLKISEIGARVENMKADQERMERQLEAMQNRAR